MVLTSGTDGASSNPTVYGRTKIKTYSKGLQFYRKQAYTPNQFLPTTIIDVYGGEIGLLGNDNDKTLYINGNQTDGIYMGSGAGVINLVSSNMIHLSSNNVRVGSGTSNLSFLEGGSWVAQSSAFTEALKTQITTNQTNIAVLKTKIQSEIIRIDIPTSGTSNGNIQILGRTQTLSPSTNYSNQVWTLNLGVLLHNNGGLGAILFNSSGQWVFTQGATQRVSVQFDITFTSLSTGIKIFTTRLLTLPQTGSLSLFNSRPMGVNYNQSNGNPLNAVLHVSTEQFIVDLSNLNRVFLETQNFFSTSGDGASVATSGRLTFYLLPY